ncbi:MAG: hypothetical protein U0M66_00375 [Bacilli bacterium]|jgi:hypothetical protein|nr:hypothetical protein [Bacilli bacterium]
MKKTIIWIVVALLSGAILGKLTFDRYENLEVEKVVNLNDKIYMLKYGSYDNEEAMAENVTLVERYVFIENDGKFSAYVGASTTKKNAQKIADIYASKNVKLTIEKVTINNDEFIQNLNEYEKLLEATEDEKSLLIVQNQILSCYEQMVVKDE